MIAPLTRFDALWTPEPNTGCHLWVGTVNRAGYGKFWSGRAPCLAHRFIVEACVGPIPDGLEIDHLCRQRGCVNPAHLEVVTRRENLIRSTHPAMLTSRTGVCVRGHTDLVWRRDGKGRYCRTCNRASCERYYSEKHT